MEPPSCTTPYIDMLLSPLIIKICDTTALLTRHLLSLFLFEGAFPMDLLINALID